VAGSNLQVITPPDDLEVDRRPPPASLSDLRDWFFWEIEEARNARAHIEHVWRDVLRMYEAIPRHATRDVPIPGAPNLEVPIGAIAADAIYAQAIDTIFQISPIVTVRPTGDEFVDVGKSLQRLINWGVTNEWGLRRAAEHTILDDVQLGTGIYYIPFVTQTYKTMTQERVTWAAPQIHSIPVEDFYLPGSSPPQLTHSRWAAFIRRMTLVQLQVSAKKLDWDLDGIQKTGSQGFVRDRRERLAKTRQSGESETDFFEVVEGHVSFDIDGDGIPEDLLVIGDVSSQQLLRVTPNPFDQRWPFETMTYQARAHMFYGIGVVEMLAAFEDEASEVHNQRTLNMILANSRMWGGKAGHIDETQDVWPNKIILSQNPKEDFIPYQMGDVYPSSLDAEQIILAYAEKRSGINDLATGRGAGLGTRTPGITALTAVQSVNQRFTPAFDAKRLATAAAVRQCLYRYQERALLNDPAVRRKFQRILGDEQGIRVFELMRSREFDDGFFVELTASSASINRDADRQNAVMLSNLLGNYYAKLLELMMLVANPAQPVSPEVRKTGLKIIDAASEAMDRTIRTFDLIRDPETFVVRVRDVFEQEANQSGVQPAQIADMMQQFANIGAQGGNGAAPAEGGLPI